MAKYGSINNVGELKLIQNANPDEVFIGINKNGFAYFFDGKQPVKITKEQLKSVLQLTAEQVDKVLKSKGTYQFDFSRDSSFGIESRIAEKSLNKQTVVAKNMDIPGGKEKSIVIDAGVNSDKVSFSDEDSLDPASLNKSNSRTLSLKNRIKELSRRVEWLEQNTVTKEQMIQIVQSLTKGE
jgi:hypothetical protein